MNCSALPLQRGLHCLSLFSKLRYLSYLVLFFVFLSFNAYGQHSPYAFNGTLDARNWDFRHKRLPLNGYWRFHPDKLLTPDECSKSKNAKDKFFPKLWNESSSSGKGFATYCLKVLAPAESDTFALALPQLYCSYELWINGLKIASNGTVGMSENETMPQWRPQVVSFSSPTDTIDITLQLANFHHDKGGARESIYLGLPAQIQRHHAVAHISNHVNTFFLALTAMVFLILYFTRGKEKVILYFALLCLVMSVRSMFSNQYTFVHFFPEFNWTWMVRIEYLTLYLINIFAVLFVSYLFTNVSHQGVKYFLITTNCLFILIALSFSPMFFTRWLNVYLFFSVVTVLYGAASVIRAIMQEQLGAWFLVISLLMTVFTFSYDLISYEWAFAYNPIVLNTGYILIFLFTGLAILLHVGVIRSNKPRTGTMLRYSDLFGKDEDVNR